MQRQDIGRPVVRKILLAIVLLLCLAGCGASEETGLRPYQIYYVNQEGNGLVSEEYRLERAGRNTVDMIQMLLGKLQTNGTGGRYKNPIQPDIEIRDFMIKEKQLSLYFTAAYNNKSGIDEILSRAAIVKTLCQVPAIDLVEFYVEDQPLTLSGNTIGLMDPDKFVDGLNPDFKEQQKGVILFFATPKGDRLVELSLEVTYSAAEPLAQILLEKLIAGPEEVNRAKLELGASVPPDTVVNSVTIRDNICYVDLSSEFMNPIPGVKGDVTVYSVVNTLCELPNVSKVQFTIDGEQRGKYGDIENFNTPYKRNLDLVSTGASVWYDP